MSKNKNKIFLFEPSTSHQNIFSIDDDYHAGAIGNVGMR